MPNKDINKYNIMNPEDVGAVYVKTIHINRDITLMNNALAMINESVENRSLSDRLKIRASIRKNLKRKKYNFKPNERKEIIWSYDRNVIPFDKFTRIYEGTLFDLISSGLTEGDRIKLRDDLESICVAMHSMDPEVKKKYRDELYLIKHKKGFKSDRSLAFSHFCRNGYSKSEDVTEKPGKVILNPK